MAVPKQKQSHSRTTKRRSTHKVPVTPVNECPHCHAKRLPHRVCGSCGYYKGREIVAIADHDHHDHDH